MLNIRPVSDLRNKYPEIEDIVLKSGEPVFLTKNGYLINQLWITRRQRSMIDLLLPVVRTICWFTIIQGV